MQSFQGRFVQNFSAHTNAFEVINGEPPSSVQYQLVLTPEPGEPIQGNASWLAQVFGRLGRLQTTLLSK